jgi:hypothetical protein
MKNKTGGKKFLKAIGSKFHSLRSDQKKEIEIVAKAVKISPALLVRIERGDYDMYLDLLFVLCDYYDITPYDFLEMWRMT